MSSQDKEFRFDTKEEFLEKLAELVKSGVQAETLTTLTPFPVHKAEHILKTRASQLRFFTLVGALAGFFLSFGFMIFTVLDWPLITGGKPLISVPAFIIVAFECTILFGGIVSFLGFLHLNRLPNLKKIIEPREYGNQFVIIQKTSAGDTKGLEDKRGRN